MMIDSLSSIKNIINNEYPYLREQFGIQRIGLFGSFAKRTAKDSNDIDLVVEFEKPIGLKFMVLAEFLEKKIGRKINLLTPAGIDSIRNHKIAKSIKESIIYV